MQCPKCQTENRDGKKFCEQCGAKMERQCPNCNANMPLGSKFCGDCGHDLSQLSPASSKDISFDEKIARIQKYLPSGITEKILSQREKIEGEKREVTVMFCDMKEFTRLSEKLGAETMYAMMDEVYEILIHKVHDYEGTVNEMTGDGVVALFGAPIALEDAPQRAIRSAIAIHREIMRFNERIREKKGALPPIKMRIGIHTGPVVVGTLGNDLRVDFKAVGDTVNLASRMESLAEPGTTYISDETFKLTEGLFRFEALGEKEIKGKEKPLKIYQVIAPSTRRTRFDVSAERGLTQFVGRERELDLLLDGFERSKEGRGQAISIVSEAGIGKSRLLYEFRKAVTNEHATFLEGRCLSYSRNVAYHPVADLLKADFDIQDNDTDREIREKVITGLKTIKVDETSTLPYLLELLAVKESGIDKFPLSPDARKDQTLEALKRIVFKGSELRPLIMAIEDLHWMDRGSEDAMRELLESIAGARVFLIFTYRPEFVHAWGSKSYHSQVTLNRLSNRETLAMATHILGTPNIERDLEELILQKTEGIPFFIEEFIKSLKGLKIIERKDKAYQLSTDIRKISIPSTIQDIIMARVDALPEGAKEVLRTGSVIEREFSYDLIKKVTGLPEQELLSHLSALKDSELLFERGIYPQCTYIFRHALTWEVVYDSILTRKKKQLHEKIAGVMECIYKDDMGYHYGVLAGHCIASESYEKGAEYSRLEAKRYQKLALYKDAIEYAKKSISSLEKLPQVEANQRKNIDCRTTLAHYYMSLSLHAEAKETVEPIMELALKMKHKKGLPAIYLAMGLYYMIIEEDFQNGIAPINEALAISEEVGDFISLWMANVQLGFSLSQFCEFEKALTHIKRCLEIGTLANNPKGISFAKSLTNQPYGLRGDVNLALRNAEEASRLAEELGDIYFKGMAYGHYGASLFFKGLPEEAEKYLLEGFAMSEKTSMVTVASWSGHYLALLYLDRGEYRKAQDYRQKVISLLERTKMLPSYLNVSKVSLVKIRIYNQDKDINLVELFEYSKNIKLNVCEGMMAATIGDILLHLDEDHFLDATVWIQKAIDADSRNGMKWYLATDHALYADWFKKKGDIYGAKEQFATAINLFRECGADGWVTRTEEALAEFS
jgi:class 3 adenylate cyclase/tetratricopeptide (TPR) repeat protein